MSKVEAITTTTIIVLMTRLAKYGRWFAGPTWDTWQVILRAMFALPLSESERAIFEKLSGGRKPPERQVREAWIIAGRRAGKSLIAAYSASSL